MKTTNCRWVITPATPGVNPHYCERPVKYNMVRDDDGNLVRKYLPFCPEHMDRAKSQAPVEDDDDFV